MKISQKIWVLVGTRPEVIKQVTVYRALVEKYGKSKVALIGTGQHRELLEQALSHFGESLDYNLDLMISGQHLGKLAAKLLDKLDEIYEQNNPELIVVQGDTTTAAMGAIAAFHRGIKVAHNEAGLRTYDLQNPYPEEANRRWIGVVADLHFAPTEKAKNYLLAEGVPSSKIFVVGNSGIDSLLWTLQKPCPEQVREMTAKWTSKNIKPVLVTAHRRENDPNKMEAWFKSLNDFLDRHKDIALVCPMHPNNRAFPSAKKYLEKNDRVWIGPALDYLSISHLLKLCRFIVTDSGGLQEESATLNIPSVVCRKVTERNECVEAGLAKLADPTDGNNILSAMNWAYEFSSHIKSGLENSTWLFGDGSTGKQIAKII